MTRERQATTKSHSLRAKGNSLFLNDSGKKKANGTPLRLLQQASSRKLTEPANQNNTLR